MMKWNLLRRLVAPAFLCTLLCCMNVSPVDAQISIVIAKSSTLDSSAATRVGIKEIFTGTRLKWANGAKISVIDQADTDVGKKFYTTVIGKSVNDMRKQWAKLLLSGQASAPVKCPSDKAVKKVIAGNPNAIGYVSTSALDDTVKEVLRIP